MSGKVRTNDNRYNNDFASMEQSIFYMREEGYDQEEIQDAIRKFVLNFNKYAMELLEGMKHASALHILEKIEELLIKFNYKDLTQVLTLTYSNLACVYKELKDFYIALNYLKKAATLCETYNQTEDTVTTYLNICVVYSQLGKHKRALDYAIKAAFKCQEHLSREDPSVKELTLLATAFHNMGIEEELLGNTIAAIEWHKKAYGILENNSDVDPEMKIQFYKKLQEITENTKTEVTRNKKPKRRICHCTAQSTIPVTETIRPTIKVVKLKPKRNMITPLIAKSRITKNSVKRNAHKRITLMTPLSSTFRECNTSKMTKPLVGCSKISKDLMPSESNGRMCKESTTDYISDLDGEVDQLLMASLNKKPLKEPPLEPLLKDIYPKGHKNLGNKVLVPQEAVMSDNESKEEEKVLEDLGVLEWSDAEDSEDEIKELYGRHNETFLNKEKVESVKKVRQMIKTDNASPTRSKPTNKKEILEKLFEGNMYLDNNNYLVKFYIEESGNVIVKLRNISSNKIQDLIFSKEQVPSVLKANSKNMAADSINALAQLLTLRKCKENGHKIQDGKLSIGMKEKKRSMINKLNENQSGNV